MQLRHKGTRAKPYQCIVCRTCNEAETNHWFGVYSVCTSCVRLTSHMCMEPDPVTKLWMKEQGHSREYIKSLIDAVLEIDDIKQARAFFWSHVEMIKKAIERGKWTGPQDPVYAAERDIGWCFAEDMRDEQIALWKEVRPSITHPVFGDHIPKLAAVLRETRQQTNRRMIENDRALEKASIYAELLDEPFEPFRCPRCRRMSHHRDDAINQYCANCHEFFP